MKYQYFINMSIINEIDFLPIGYMWRYRNFFKGPRSTLCTQVPCLAVKKWNRSIITEEKKEGDLTQPYDKTPYTNRKFENQRTTHTNAEVIFFL